MDILWLFLVPILSLNFVCILVCFQLHMVGVIKKLTFHFDCIVIRCVIICKSYNYSVLYLLNDNITHNIYIRSMIMCNAHAALLRIMRSVICVYVAMVASMQHWTNKWYYMPVTIPVAMECKQYFLLHMVQLKGNLMHVSRAHAIISSVTTPACACKGHTQHQKDICNR